MLQITVPCSEFYDEASNRIIKLPSVNILLEHSLLSISKWESIWHKPFITRTPKTTEETISYVKCMTIQKNIPDSVYGRLSQENIDLVNEYIDDSMTATTFRKDDSLKTGSRNIITSEIIYWWMIQAGIPFECQRWHLNRLLTLINVVNLKKQPPRKMSQAELNARNRALNLARKNQYKTRG